jgi:hypothetical protein
MLKDHELPTFHGEKDPMTPHPAGAPRTYHDLFDPRIAGFSPVFPLVLSAGLFISYHVFLLFDFLLKDGRLLKDLFPSFQIEQGITAIASAFLLLWLGRQMENAWLIGLAYGACDSLIGITISWVSRLVTAASLSSIDWFPQQSLHLILTNLFWGVLLIGLVNVAIRLAGVRVLPILGSGLVSWSVFGFCDNLLGGGMHAEWQDLARWATSGLLFGLAMYLGLRGQLALRAAHVPLPEIALRSRISKGFFFTAIVIGNIAGYLLILGAARATSNWAAAFMLAGFALMVFSSIVAFVLVHRMWSAIQDGFARASPGQAVGMLFIPFYNFYWLFQAFWGFAQDFNAYRNRHVLQTSALSPGLFLTFCILSLFGWIPLAPIITAILFVEMFMIAKVCDAINAIPA